MTGDRPIGEDDLHAFVEGRLPPERREAVETFLADHPAAAAQVAADRERREALRARLAFKADEPIPARLRIAHVRAERRSVQGRRLAAVAAALAWLVVGGATGWTAHAWMARPIAANQSRVAQDALSAHRVFVAEIAHPVEVGAAQQAHLLQWLSKRLGRSLQAPDLAALGYHLMGGRLLPAGNEPAAQLMYEDDRGARLTLYIRASDSGETSFRFAQSGEVSAFSWIDGGLGYVISAALDRERLLRIAEAVYRQLDHAPSPESKRL